MRLIKGAQFSKLTYKKLRLLTVFIIKKFLFSIDIRAVDTPPRDPPAYRTLAVRFEAYHPAPNLGQLYS